MHLCLHVKYREVSEQKSPASFEENESYLDQLNKVVPVCFIRQVES